MISCLLPMQCTVFAGLQHNTASDSLNALDREISLKTIQTCIHKNMHDLSQFSIDCRTPASRLRRSAPVWTSDRMRGMIQTEARRLLRRFSPMGRWKIVGWTVLVGQYVCPSIFGNSARTAGPIRTGVAYFDVPKTAKRRWYLMSRLVAHAATQRLAKKFSCLMFEVKRVKSPNPNLQVTRRLPNLKSVVGHGLLRAM